MLAVRDGAVLVGDVFEGGPAREAGIRPGEWLELVDGATVAGVPLADVVQRVRGLVGTSVSPLVRRDGRDSPIAVPRVLVKF